MQKVELYDPLLGAGRNIPDGSVGTLVDSPVCAHSGRPPTNQPTNRPTGPQFVDGHRREIICARNFHLSQGLGEHGGGGDMSLVLWLIV